jgi:hypothetical protein
MLDERARDVNELKLLARQNNFEGFPKNSVGCLDDKRECESILVWFSHTSK